MTGHYRFAKTINGVGSYAAIGIHASAAVSFSVTWELVDEDTTLHSSIVNCTIEEVFKIHRRRGGSIMAFKIVALEELVAHTTVNAIACATFLATWQALGYDQNDLELKNNGAEWVIISPASAP